MLTQSLAPFIMLGKKLYLSGPQFFHSYDGKPALWGCYMRIGGNVKNVAGYLAAFTDQSHSGSVKIKLVSFRAVCIEAVVANLVTP